MLSYDGHTSNVMALGFQKDGKWMYSGEQVHSLLKHLFLPLQPRPSFQ